MLSFTFKGNFIASFTGRAFTASNSYPNVWPIHFLTQTIKISPSGNIVGADIAPTLTFLTC